MKQKKNSVTLAYCALGSQVMIDDERKLRASLNNKAPDNNTILAMPYPYHAGRGVWTNLFVETNEQGQMVTSYSVTFAHYCLLWQHSRIYDLTQSEYESLNKVLALKYGAPSLAVFEPSDHVRMFNLMHTWSLPAVTSIANK